MIAAALSFVSFFVAVDKESDSPVGANTYYHKCKKNQKKTSVRCHLQKIKLIRHGLFTGVLYLQAKRYRGIGL